jgi:hypothetical protein
MKNIPITSRIQKSTDKGMVKNPLLNLGSPLKSTGSDPKVKNKAKTVNEGLVSSGSRDISTQATISTTSPDTIIKGPEKMEIVIKPPKRTAEGDKAYEKLTPAERKAQDARYNKNKANQMQVGTGEFEDYKIIPGKTTTTTAKGSLYKPLEGDAKRPWQRREDSRSIKKTAKDVRRAEIKGAKLDAKSLGLKDKEYRDTMKSVRRGAKKNEIAAELKGFEGARDAAVRQGVESRATGGKLDLGGEVMQKYDFSKEEQTKANTAGAVGLMSKSPFKMKGYGKKKC